MIHKQRILSVFMVIVMVLSLAACGGSSSSNSDAFIKQAESEGLSYFDIVAGIDEASIEEKADGIYFTSVASDGTPLRFQLVGKGNVSSEGIYFGIGSFLVSLDSMGHIRYIGAILEDYSDADEMALYGSGYSADGSPSVETANGLMLCPIGGVFAEDYKGDPQDITEFFSNYLFFSPENNLICTMSGLWVAYDPSVPPTDYKTVDNVQLQASVMNAALYAESRTAAQPGTPGSGEYIPIEHGVLANPERYTCFDIVESMDPNSIVTDGNLTYFNAYLPDGSVIRFEADGVMVQEGLLEFAPGSTLTSLDAIGQIAGYDISQPDFDVDNSGRLLSWGYAYTFSEAKTSVQSPDELIRYCFTSIYSSEVEGLSLTTAEMFMPNFIYIQAYMTDGPIQATAMRVYYDPSVKTTGVRDLCLNLNFTTAYLEGELYNPERESGADSESGDFSFYLIVEPDTPYGDMSKEGYSIYFVENTLYSVGNLKDASGNVLNKNNTRIEKGTVLEITIGDYTIDMEIPVVDRYAGAQNMNDLVPYAYPEALGDVNTLVVPVIWADQTDMANEETLQLFREGIGRIVDENGTVTDYSVLSDQKFSLSEYYDISSYGKMKITSFMTDWYYTDMTFAECYDHSPDEVYSNQIMDWVRETYPDIDFSIYDQDGNGYVDSMVILNAGYRNSDELFIISYEGAINYRHSYFGDYAGTQEAPRVNTYTNVGYRWLKDDYSTIIHEYAHGLGLIDYYDVTYSGISAVGEFDMQAESLGDWNAYSKYAVGWLDPYVVTGLESGESIEYTIGSLALCDDAIIIPAAGSSFDGPFSEYIMIDLFSDDGVNEYQAKQYHLGDTAGVRISHVNANMEKRTIEEASKLEGQENSQPVSYDIGTIHFANDYKQDGKGRYNIEVIQSSGNNTFTDLSKVDPVLKADDLFYEGDTFTVEDYDEFFYNGLMDDGSVFGYTVQIVSIGNDANGIPTATIRITAQ